MISFPTYSPFHIEEPLLASSCSDDISIAKDLSSYIRLYHQFRRLQLRLAMSRIQGSIYIQFILHFMGKKEVEFGQLLPRNLKYVKHISDRMLHRLRQSKHLQVSSEPLFNFNNLIQ